MTEIKKETPKQRTRTLYLTSDINEAINGLAVKNDLSASQMVRKILKEYFKKNK